MANYIQDPNDSKKQVPNSTGKGYQQMAGYSINPAAETRTRQATYVTVNKVGTFAFSYPDQTTGAGTSSYITGAMVQNAAGGPVKLDINPTNWRRTDGASVTGDITFVYRRIT
jgi:hypothetical protein